MTNESSGSRSQESLPELYVAVDVEADGPIPGPFSMLSIGMAVVDHPELSFYSELKPISEDFVPAALKVAGLDRERLTREAPSPAEAMTQAARFINSLKKMGRPVFLAAPAVWDGMFVHWYFVRYVGHSPFGPTGGGIDLRSYWMALRGGEWAESRKAEIKALLGVHGFPHTHNALDDARELAATFSAVLRHRSSLPRAEEGRARGRDGGDR